MSTILLNIAGTVLLTGVVFACLFTIVFAVREFLTQKTDAIGKFLLGVMFFGSLAGLLAITGAILVILGY